MTNSEVRMTNESRMPNDEAHHSGGQSAAARKQVSHVDRQTAPSEKHSGTQTELPLHFIKWYGRSLLAPFIKQGHQLGVSARLSDFVVEIIYSSEREFGSIYQSHYS